MRLPQRSSKAFTLIELIVVIVILGILALIAIPTFGKVVTKSQDESTLSSLRAMARNAQALKAMDQASAWGTIPADSIGEVNTASAAGTQAAILTAVVDDGTKNPLAGQVTYFVKGDGVVLSMLSGSKKICVVGFDSSTMGKGLCQVPTAGATTSLGSSLSDGTGSVLPPATTSSSGGSGSGGTPAPTGFASVAAWGQNNYGQLGTGAKGNLASPAASTYTNAVSISSSPVHSCAALTSGKVECVGDTSNGQLGTTTPGSGLARVEVTGITNATMVATGGNFTCALLATAKVKCWGYNFNGQSGTGTTSTSNSTPVDVISLTGVTSIAASASTMYALKSDGTIWAWGSNGAGALGINSTTVSFSATPVQVSGIATATAVSARDAGAYATLSDGTVMAWGSNTETALGPASTTGQDAYAPIPVTGLPKVKMAYGYGYGGLALLPDGTVMAWGQNSEGQLGQGGNRATSKTPLLIPGLSGVASIATTRHGAAALLSDGTVKSWGYSLALGTGSSTSTGTPTLIPGLTGIGSIQSGVDGYSMFALK